MDFIEAPIVKTVYLIQCILLPHTHTMWGQDDLIMQTKYPMMHCTFIDAFNGSFRSQK